MTANSAAPAKKRSLMQWLKGYTGQKYTTTLLFLLIPVVLLILFTVIPAINMGIYSFQKRDQLGVSWEWVGFDNYVRIFTDGAYLQTSLCSSLRCSAPRSSSAMRSREYSSSPT